jgi:uncharacterized protein YdeI (YjbR/CyaY-like superfamily)
MAERPLAFATAAEWRSWLQDNHARQDEAWLTISKKHSGAPFVSLSEATEEALCFGWIDSFMRPIDGERYALRYSPRRPGSNWSPTNRALAARLIDEGRMTEAGLAKIEEARRNGRWDEP